MQTIIGCKASKLHAVFACATNIEGRNLLSQKKRVSRAEFHLRSADKRWDVCPRPMQLRTTQLTCKERQRRSKGRCLSGRGWHACKSREAGVLECRGQGAGDARRRRSAHRRHSVVQACAASAGISPHYHLRAPPGSNMWLKHVQFCHLVLFFVCFSELALFFVCFSELVLFFVHVCSLEQCSVRKRFTALLL